MALLCWFQNRSSSTQPRPRGDSCVFAQLRKYGKLSFLDKPESLHVRIYAQSGNEHEHALQFTSTFPHQSASREKCSPETRDVNHRLSGAIRPRSGWRGSAKIVWKERSELARRVPDTDVPCDPEWKQSSLWSIFCLRGKGYIDTWRNSDRHLNVLNLIILEARSKRFNNLHCFSVCKPR